MCTGKVYCLLLSSDGAGGIVSTETGCEGHARAQSLLPGTVRTQRAVASLVFSKAGTTPNCCISPRASQVVWESMIFPPAIWWMVIPPTDTFLFVAGTPM